MVSQRPRAPSTGRSLSQPQPIIVTQECLPRMVTYLDFFFQVNSTNLGNFKTQSRLDERVCELPWTTSCKAKSLQHVGPGACTVCTLRARVVDDLKRHTGPLFYKPGSYALCIQHPFSWPWEHLSSSELCHL